jgi:hypothetical protein
MRKRGRFTSPAHALALLLLALLGLGADNPTAIEAGVDYGAGLSLTRVSRLPEVLASADQHTAEPVLVRGRISEVCQRKGCWTILVDGDAAVRVRFKDYGFFLPTDSSGRNAYVEGVVTIEMLSEKQARHYASESSASESNASELEAGDAESIRGPQREVGFVASGVRIVERP